MPTKKDLYIACREDPQFESDCFLEKKLRGPQAEIVKKIERFIESHEGGVMTILSSRQTGKNELAAILQSRHLWRRQNASTLRSWIRTAPTYTPQVVNSKKRLGDVMKIDHRNVVHHGLFERARIAKSEGYIWRLGNASVEFISSGPQAKVVGATASECLDMDEAHKVVKSKFDEDFAPFTANTNAATLLWGVAADGHDTIEWYRNSNKEAGRPDLNLYFPCDVWVDVNPKYKLHIEERISTLGWDHPIMKTQYRLIPVSAEGRFLSDAHIRNLFNSDHEKQLRPRDGSCYEALIDLAGSNENVNPNNLMEGNEDTATDSTIIWIYELSGQVASNQRFPIIRIVNLKWITGASLPDQEKEIKETLRYWRVSRVTIDSVGIGRQMGESMEQIFGESTVNKYTANETSVSADCFDLQARLNFSSIKMYRDDGSKEWAEFERQCGWTKYSSSKGKMKLEKPDSRKHIDMVKALTYINQNAPVSGMAEIYSIESEPFDV